MRDQSKVSHLPQVFPPLSRLLQNDPQKLLKEMESRSVGFHTYAHYSGNHTFPVVNPQS